LSSSFAIRTISHVTNRKDQVTNASLAPGAIRDQPVARAATRRKFKALNHAHRAIIQRELLDNVSMCLPA